MRQIGSLENDDLAARFVDFLKTIDISAQTEEDGDRWLIWVRDENQLDVARQELGKFQADPDAEQYKQAAKVAFEIRSTEIKKRMEVKKNLHQARDTWSGPLSKRAPVTLALIIVCVAVAALGGGFENVTFFDHILKFADVHNEGFNGDSFQNIRRGQIWRIVTPIFLHGGLRHIVFNLYMLYVFGTQIESKAGSAKLLAIVLATAIVPNILQAVLVHPNFVGISGVVYGLLGYMLVRRSDGYRISNFLLIAVAVFFVIDMAPGSGVAIWAHAGGIAIGALIGYFPKLRVGF